LNFALVDVGFAGAQLRAMLSAQQQGHLSMAMIEHKIYPPPTSGGPFVVVGLVRVGQRNELGETFLAATKGDAERICRERQQAVAGEKPRKRGVRWTTEGKRLLTPKRGDNA
jgi:hypothetical protein